MLKRKFTYENLVDLLVPLVCIFLGFIVGMILIAVAGKNPFGAYFALFQGAFGSLSNISESVLKTAVLIFTGLSVGLAYRVGLFNIGAEGQFIIGAISAAFIGHWVRLPAFLHIPLILLFAMITSGIWALIAGWLKVSRGVHEVISTIMLNWVAYYLVENWLIVGPMAVQGAAGSTISEAGTPMIYPTAKLWRFVSDVPDLIGKIFVLLAIALVVFFLAYYALKRGTKIRGKALWVFSVITTAVVSALSAVFVFQWQSGIPGIRMNIGIFIAIAAVVIIYFLLFRTVLGYEIRAIGFNNQAAKYAGINVKRNILLTMFLAGALSGLGGVLMVCGTEFRFPGVFPGGYGFDGIAMALIGQNSPFGILLASILFGIIRGGSTAMQLPPYKIHKTFADIIQGSVVLFISAYFIIRYILMLPRKRREV